MKIFLKYSLILIIVSCIIVLLTQLIKFQPLDEKSELAISNCIIIGIVFMIIGIRLLLAGNDYRNLMHENPINTFEDKQKEVINKENRADNDLPKSIAFLIVGVINIALTLIYYLIILKYSI